MFDHRYAYQGYEKKGAQLRTMAKTELIGLNFVDGRVLSKLAGEGPT